MTPIHISRRQLYLLWCMAWFLLLVLLIQPISYAIMRATVVFLITAIWLGVIYIWWKRISLRVGIVVVTLGLAMFLASPGRAIDIESLRADYVRFLNAYVGTPYVWGGENRFGIDCSGLVRQALIEANWHQGITTLNPLPIRRGLAMWWFDLSAMSLRDGARGWTQQLFRVESINALDPTRLLAGDLATTVDGQHVLAYAGDRRWIEADPLALKTIAVDVPNRDNFWFQTPVYVLRWDLLAPLLSRTTSI